MTLSLRDVVEDNFHPESLAQATLVARLKDLAKEGDELAAYLARIDAIKLRMAQVKIRTDEVLKLLESLPNEGCGDPAHFGGLCT